MSRIFALPWSQILNKPSIGDLSGILPLDKLPAHTHSWADIPGLLPVEKLPLHNHDSSYYTKAQVDAAIGGIDLSSRVPYTGATGAVNLGANGLSAGNSLINGQLGVGPGSANSFYFDSAFNLKCWNGATIGWSASSGVGNATTVDVSLRRNATGPAIETRSAGGLVVNNADGTALAGLQCGQITIKKPTQGGIVIREFEPSNGGWSNFEIAGANFGLGTGLRFTNHLSEVSVNSTFRALGSFGASVGVFGSTGSPAAAEDSLRLYASAGTAYLYTMKYASSPYPALQVSGQTITLKTGGGAWPAGSGYGTTALTIDASQNIAVAGNIEPITGDVSNIGSATKRFLATWTNGVQFGGSTNLATFSLHGNGILTYADGIIGPKFISTGMRMPSGLVYGFSDGNSYTGTTDTAISRASAGVVAVGNGTAGNASGTLHTSTIGTPSGSLILNPWDGIVRQSNSIVGFGSGLGGFISDALRGFVFSQYTGNITNGFEFGLFRSGTNAAVLATTQAGTTKSALAVGTLTSANQAITSTSTATGLTIDQPYNGNGINVVLAAGGTAYNFSSVSTQATGFNGFINSSETWPSAASRAVVAGTMQSGVDVPFISGGSFVAIQTKASAGTYTNYAIGVRGYGTAVVAGKGIGVYGTCPTANDIPIVAARQTYGSYAPYVQCLNESGRSEVELQQGLIAGYGGTLTLRAGDAANTGFLRMAYNFGYPNISSTGTFTFYAGSNSLTLGGSYISFSIGATPVVLADGTNHFKTRTSNGIISRNVADTAYAPVISAPRLSTVAPNTTDIASGACVWWHDSTANARRFAYNDTGSIYQSPLLKSSIPTTPSDLAGVIAALQHWGLCA